MFAHLLAAACAVALAPCTTARAEATFKPYASGLAPITYITSNRAEPKRLYVVEQDGRIVYMTGGRVRGTFLDLRSVIRSGGEQGLLSMAFHPAYARNHRFYVNYTDRNGDTRVVEFRSRSGKGVRSSARQLLFVKQPFPNHNGGQLQFGPDGQLYVGMGDGGSAGDPGDRAQNLSERLGKLLKANATARTPVWRIAAYGLRNPWRFSFDRSSHTLWIGDVGQNRWEEVDRVTSPARRTLRNFGWSRLEGRSVFNPGRKLTGGTLVRPLTVLPHPESIAIVGGYVYRGSDVPALRGYYLYSDNVNGWIRGLKLRGAHPALRFKKTAGVPSGVTSFGEDGRGNVFVCTYGAVYRIVK